MNKNDSNAPEVVESNGADGLIPAHNTIAEPPQIVPQYPSYDKPNPPANQHDGAYSPSYGSHDEKPAAVGLSEAAFAKPKSAKRKRLIWIIIGVVLLALAIGLGVGLGLGLSRSGGSSSSTSNQNLGVNTVNGEAAENTSETSTTTSTTSTASATSSAVVSGTTGLAEFSCNSTETTESSDGTPYVQECYTQYQTGHPSFYSRDGNITMANLGGKITVYTFQDCLDKCDERNAAGASPPCRAVTYYANISVPIRAWGGNCFLKNDRGNGYQTDEVDYSHTASAYQSCLNSTCYGSNA